LDSEEELAGILGHEISHVVCRHISQRIERSKKISLATSAGMLAGILLGAGGAGTAGNALAIGSLATGESLSLSYSREDERQADEIGLKYLAKTGYGGKGLLTSLKKIRSQQWFGSDQIPNYLLTHPAAEERMAYIDNWLAHHHKKDQPNHSHQPTDGQEFQRIHTRMIAQYADEPIAKARFLHLLSQNPENALAHYGYGMLLSRLGDQTGAVQHLKKALEISALNPYYLMELGWIYFSEGAYQKSAAILTSATGIVDDINAKFYLGRAQMELGKFDQAVNKFEEVIKTKTNFNQVYYYLGEAYGKQKKLGEAHYNLGIYYYNKQDLKNTKFHLKRAIKILSDPEKQKKAKLMLAKLPRHPNSEIEKTNARMAP
jgi:beta-barrel assembly-enhancing protease